MRLRLRICKAWSIRTKQSLQQGTFVSKHVAKMQNYKLARVFAAWRESAVRHASLLQAASRLTALIRERSAITAFKAWQDYVAEQEKLRRKLLALQKSICLRCSADTWKAWASYAKCSTAKKGALEKCRAHVQASIVRQSLEKWHAYAAERKRLQTAYSQIYSTMSWSLKRTHLFHWQHAVRMMQRSRSQVKVSARSFH